MAFETVRLPFKAADPFIMQASDGRYYLYCTSENDGEFDVPGFPVRSSDDLINWQDHGLKGKEENIVLIGDGKYAENLLTRGLLLNVYGPERTVRYHLFGNWENFLRNHHRLAARLCPEGENKQPDPLHFHRKAWNEDGGKCFCKLSEQALCTGDLHIVGRELK